MRCYKSFYSQLWCLLLIKFNFKHKLSFLLNLAKSWFHLFSSVLLNPKTILYHILSEINELKNLYSGHHSRYVRLLLSQINKKKKHVEQLPIANKHKNSSRFTIQGLFLHYNPTVAEIKFSLARTKIYKLTLVPLCLTKGENGKKKKKKDIAKLKVQRTF